VVASPRPDGRWERNAAWWQREFTDGADPEYEEQILPLAEEWLSGYERVVDIGAGEGQIARRLVRGGAEFVVGVDPTAAQLTVAGERGGGVRYLRAAAEQLPLADASFDAAVACLVFEHLPDHTVPITEVARVLRAGGRFAFFLNHPLLQCPGSGWIDDHILEEQYWRVGPYLPTDVTLEQLAPGVVLQFVHRPLSAYVNAMAAVGLLVRHMDEPAPPPGFVRQAPEYEAAATIPRLLLLVAEKIG
jgi:SAM-dependent methyltransferase